jgi:protein-S-isoprenylcysteine O-methyltransferase Ste14
MGFEDILGYAALAGVAFIVIGTILLALFPRWGGFRTQRADEEPPSPLEAIVKALVAAFTGFVTIVRDMVTGEAGKYHPGQVFIAVGFLLFLACALLWVVTQIAGGG